MTTARPILVVVGDDTVLQALTEHVAVAGTYHPAKASTLREAIRHLIAPNARFDLIILGVNLPDGDGPDFCAWLRDRGYRIPIVMLSEAADDDDVVRALNAGATDSIVMPFRTAELVARVRAAFRSHDDRAYAVFTIGPWTFSPEEKRLTRQDGSRSVRLAGKDVSLLKYFCSAGDRVVSRQALLSAVWGYHADVRTHTLQTHIYRLRQSLEPEPRKPLFLLTDPGGYRLNRASAPFGCAFR